MDELNLTCTKCGQGLTPSTAKRGWNMQALCSQHATEWRSRTLDLYSQTENLWWFIFIGNNGMKTMEGDQPVCCKCGENIEKRFGGLHAGWLCEYHYNMWKQLSAENEALWQEAW